MLLNLLVWTLLVVAVARPVWVEKPIERQQPVRDLMLAIDISQSMQTTDFTDASGQRIDRLSAVKLRGAGLYCPAQGRPYRPDPVW